MSTTLQHWLKQLSGLRASLRNAASGDDVLAALAGALVPRIAARLEMVRPDGIRSVTLPTPQDDAFELPTLPDAIWADVGAPGVWVGAADRTGRAGE